MIGRFALISALITCFTLFTFTSGFCQEKPEADSLQKTEVPEEQLSVVDVDKLVAEVSESSLDEETKTQLNSWLGQARSQLEKAGKLQADAEVFRDSIESAAEDIENARSKTDLPEPYDFSNAEYLSANQLNADRTALEQELSEARKSLQVAQQEPKRRIERRGQIPGELTAAQRSLSETERMLESADAGDQSLQARAKKLQLQSDKLFYEATIEKLENERDAYQAQGELPQLNVDRLTALVSQLNNDDQKLLELLKQQRETDAENQREKAQQTLDRAPDRLKEYAQAIVDLTERRKAVAGEIIRALAKRESTEKKLIYWQEHFERTKSRVSAVSSKAVGLLLEERRQDLPSIAVLWQAINSNAASLTETQYELYELQDRRADLSNVELLVDETIRSNNLLTDRDRDSLNELFELELSVLRCLLEDTERNYNLRVSAREDQEKLINLVLEFREYINQQIFWYRSSKPINLETFSHAGQAVTWLFNRETAVAAGRQITKRFLTRPVLTILFPISVLILFLVRPILRQRLSELGEIASRISCRSIKPTLQALWITLMLAAPWPLAFMFVNWLLRDSVHEPVRGIANACLTTSYWLMSLEVIRKIWRPNGLAESHFQWNRWTGMHLNRNLTILFYAGSFFVFFGAVCYQHGIAEFRHSLGRLNNIGWILLVGYVLFDVLRPDRQRKSNDQTPFINVSRMRKLGSYLVVLIAVGLVVLSVRGYGYTTYQLTLDFELTFSVVFGLFILRGILFRWVRMNRRRMRREQLIEARQKSAGEEDAQQSDIDALVAEEESTDLHVVDQQTRRLINVLSVSMLLAAMSLIWYDSIQAITPILEREIRPVTVGGVAVRSVTWGSVLLALFVIVVVVVSFRNMKGLVDLVFSGQWAVEASTRYAISTVLEYIIALVGVSVAAYNLGFEWSNVQWLVAALGVGLGFGLQEIVANFICGIILLFEQPIRIGDWVTVGETEGIVIRMRSRATTIRNWDRQEVIIPNKELVTGRIINWTLSDDMSRITVNVGVAYGTDTNRVRDLLKQICSENEHVLVDPAPLITFDQFADSTLNFTVRTFVTSVGHRLETTHQLHSEIHKRFGEEGIEIAFPQRDLHIRSDVRSTDESEPAWSAQDEPE